MTPPTEGGGSSNVQDAEAQAARFHLLGHPVGAAPDYRCPFCPEEHHPTEGAA